MICFLGFKEKREINLRMVDFRKIIENITKKLKKEDTAGNVAEIDKEKKIDMLLEKLGKVKERVAEVGEKYTDVTTKEFEETREKIKDFPEKESGKQIAETITHYPVEGVGKFIKERAKKVGGEKVGELYEKGVKVGGGTAIAGGKAIGKGAKWTGKKAYEGKPSENVEKYAKIFLPIVAIIIGIVILTILPGLWIIGIPAIIIGIGYLLVVVPEMDKFSFKQKTGVLVIITGGLLAFVFGVIWYGLALLFLGGAFIAYDWLPKGRGKLAIKVIELGVTLALLILVVPAFLNWAGISISLGALALFSALNTFLLFVFWSFSSGQSVKESLEEELLKKQIEEADAKTKKLKDEEGVEAAYKKSYEEKNKLTEAGKDWIEGANSEAKKLEEEAGAKKESVPKKKEICNICGGEIELYAGGKRCKKCGAHFEE